MRKIENLVMIYKQIGLIFLTRKQTHFVLSHDNIYQYTKVLAMSLSYSINTNSSRDLDPLIEVSVSAQSTCGGSQLGFERLKFQGKRSSVFSTVSV